MNDALPSAPNPLRKVKRNYDTNCTCSRCNIISLHSNIEYGYQCRYCSKYNDVEEASKRFDSGEGVYPEDKHSDKFRLNMVRVSESTEGYRKLKDEMEIRSDYFVRGKTRANMGSGKFKKEMRKELKKAKCYRGDTSEF